MNILIYQLNNFFILRRYHILYLHLQRLKSFMQKLSFVLIFMLCSAVVFGQTDPEEKPTVQSTDTTVVKVKDTTAAAQKKGNKESLLGKLTKGDSNEKKAKIQDYLIISHKRDTTYVDTTLTIQKEYKFNYRRKDNFGLLSFANIGQTYNQLSKDFTNLEM